MADEKPPVDGEEDKTEEEMLAEWQDMASDEPATDELAAEGVEGAAAAEDGVIDERVLDQNEIDSLLGGGDDKPNNVGIRALVESNVVNYERLPMLDVIFDKFERFLSTSLRHFTADNVEITIEDINSVRFGDFLNSIPLPAGIVVVNAVGLDDYMLMIYESKLIYSVVDILLGGRKSRPAKVEGRNFTTIERKIMGNLSDVMLGDLSEAFSPVAPIQFTAERMEVNPRFANITRPGNAAILVRIRINLEGREGNVQFCLPYATLEPIREQLLQQFMGEKFGQDNIWENHLAQELYYTNFQMQAVLDEVNFSLSEVVKWKVGDTIKLSVDQESDIQIRWSGVTKLVGKMGKIEGNKAVKITKSIVDINNMYQD